MVVLDIGPDIDPFYNMEENSEIDDIMDDLQNLHELYIELNNCTESSLPRPIETLRLSPRPPPQPPTPPTPSNEPSQELPQPSQKRLLSRGAAVICLGALGGAGFLINPIVGVSAVICGGGVGWLVTRK
jgi:hypothetical protein